MATNPKRKGNRNLVTGASVKPGVAPCNLQACQHTTAKQQAAKNIAIQGVMLYSLADRYSFFCCEGGGNRFL